MKQLKLSWKLRRRLVVISIVLHILCFVALLLSFLIIQKHIWVALLIPFLIAGWLPIMLFLIFVRFSSMVFNTEYRITGRQRRSYPAANSIVYGFPNSWIEIGNKSFFLRKRFPCRWHNTQGVIEFFSPIFGAGTLRWENILTIRRLTKNRFEIQHDSPEFKSPIVVPEKLVYGVLIEKTEEGDTETGHMSPEPEN